MGIRLNYKNILGTFIACLSILMATAQTVNVVQEIDGQAYFMHTVEAGHTLYAISKLYNVEVEDIIKANPQAKEGIRVGEVLKVPAKGSKPEETLSNPIRIDGDELVHRVLKGETLFAISKMYNVDVNTILEKNPDANSGLQKGMELHIPVNKVVTDDMADIQPAQEDSLIRHTVIQGETLYAIAKRYEVSITELTELNGGLPEGLKAGQTIRIPKANEQFKLQTEEKVFEPVITDPKPIKDSYKIHLMLPFHLESTADKSATKQQRLREVSMSMYRGVMMALDSLEEMGLNAEIIVEDVYDESSYAASSFKKNGAQSHLLIGPLQRSVLTRVGDDARKNAVHVVCPVPQSNKVLLGHPTLSKVDCSELTEIDSLARYLAANHNGANIILFNSGFTNDIKRLTRFRTAFDNARTPGAPPFLVTEHKAEGKTAGNLAAKLNPLMENIIVALTDNEVIIADVLRVLGSQEETKSTIYANADWLDLKFVDEEQMERHNIHIASSTFVNAESASLQNFREQFKDRFNAFADQYALMAYDVTRYYGEGLLRFGTGFPAAFDQISYTPLITGFDLKKTGLESGYENQHVFILEQVDYQLKSAREDDIE